MRRLAPRPLSLAVGDLRAKLAPTTLLAAVQAAWPEVVGEAIAREARPVRERRGEIVVACRSSVWSQELELMGPELISRLEAVLGAGRVTALTCRVSNE